MKFIRDNELSYWDKYYSNKKFQSNSIPSQFAVFAISELNDLKISNVIECGAGNGRDSIFFSRYGKNVIATDRSVQAIDSLSKKTKDITNLNVSQHDVKDSFPREVTDLDGLKAFYARFFLHSLDRPSLEMFFENTATAMNHSDILLVEYRNEDDANLPKVTEIHYREYYSSKLISNIAKDNNLSCLYEVSGLGYAKFKHDDAFVTRQIFTK